MHKRRTSKSGRKVKIPTPERLRNIALHYLGRYAASENSLRRVLERRIMRAAHADPEFAANKNRHEELRIEIETIIAAHRKTGALNDAAYAEMKTRSLRRSGRSGRVITQKLSLKGVAKDVIAQALHTDECDADSESTELKAAHILAKRKKLGPYRVGATDFDKHRKDIAAMARAGFALNIIRKVLDVKAADLEDAEFGQAFGDF